MIVRYLFPLFFLVVPACTMAFVKPSVAIAAIFSSLIAQQPQCYVLGTEDVPASIKQRAEDVFRQLGHPEPEKILVKYMSPLLKSCTPPHAGCITTHNALFIDKEWFLALPPEKQQFVLGHEGQHIKNRDTLKKAIAYSAVGAVGIAAVSNYKTLGIGGVVGAGISSGVALAALCRHQEACADKGGELVAPEAFSDHYHYSEPASYFEACSRWLSSWFDTYPSDRFKKKHI